MAGRVEGKVAIVTGSTGGLGETIARVLAGEGAAVLVSGRRAAEAERIAAEIAAQGGKAVGVRADMGEPEECVALAEAAVQAFGALDIVVNNAADLAYAPFEELTVPQWDHAFAVNVRGPFLLSRAALPHLRARGGGSIINIGTCHAYTGGLDRVAYGASKGALLTLTKTMARSLLADQIRVNWIIVGWMITPQEIALKQQTHGNGETFLREVGEQRPMGRHETPEDIAAGVLYLASDEASHVTGCELNITGGLRI